MTNQDSPWDKYAILSLDGGGIRGYASMLLLEELMRHVQRFEQDPSFLNTLNQFDATVNTNVAESSFHPCICPIQNQALTGTLFLPCHYFDCVIGTSTGGLIAIMLGRLRMTAALAREQFRRLGDEIFGSPRWFHYRNTVFVPRSKFDYRNLESALRQVVRDFDSSPRRPNGFPNPAFCKTDEDLCKTIVTAYGTVRDPDTGTVLEDGTYFFQTYDSPEKNDRQRTKNPGIAHPGPIWEVARASTAAITYFDPCEITAFNGNIWRFHDAGMIEVNNPTEEGINEVERWGPHRNTDAFDAVVSIGTGSYPAHRTVPRRAGGIRDVINTLFNGFMARGNRDVIHQRVLDRFPTTTPRKYWRFDDLDTQWEGIPLDAWENSFDNGSVVRGGRTLTTMRDLINDYLQNPLVQNMLKECAETLVKKRRLRQAADPNRWERFSLATVYKCDSAGCFRKFATRDEFILHFQARNSEPSDAQLDACRYPNWTYRF